ncbi:MAG: Gfo/Idh/MocA family oxidoreductase [Planctomycetes bacterium]|nr:Gfo/Idh/MocA family oxidoreductase [Planctomycetota bacterium]
MSVKRPREGETLKALVVGVGHLGKQHARVYRELEGVELVGVVDEDMARAREVGGRLGVEAFPRLTGDLLMEVHAVSVVTPTPTHLEVARRCIEAGASVLVEKPMASSVEEARSILDLAKQRGVTLQIGHIERFNPVVLAATPFVRSPVFIECDRIHPFSFRSVETSVVLDLMIHDIDIVLNLVNSPVADLDSVGARVISGTDDLASARIVFNNGCIAMFKASRVAIQKSRKMRIFCEDCYVSLDYVAKTGMRISLKEGWDRDAIDFKKMAQIEASEGPYPIFTQYFSIQQLSIADDEPLRNELKAFAAAVRSGAVPVVTGEHGLQAMEVASRIQYSIAKSQEDYLRRRSRGGDSECRSP